MVPKMDMEADLFVNWNIACMVCQQLPTVSFKPTRIYEAGRGKGIEMKVYHSDLCGVCHFGTASELGWYNDIPFDRHIGEPNFGTPEEPIIIEGMEE